MKIYSVGLINSRNKACEKNSHSSVYNIPTVKSEKLNNTTFNKISFKADYRWVFSYVYENVPTTQKDIGVAFKKLLESALNKYDSTALANACMRFLNNKKNSLSDLFDRLNYPRMFTDECSKRMMDAKSSFPKLFSGDADHASGCYRGEKDSPCFVFENKCTGIKFIQKHKDEIVVETYDKCDDIYYSELPHTGGCWQDDF